MNKTKKASITWDAQSTAPSQPETDVDDHHPCLAVRQTSGLPSYSTLKRLIPSSQQMSCDGGKEKHPAKSNKTRQQPYHQSPIQNNILPKVLVQPRLDAHPIKPRDLQITEYHSNTTYPEYPIFRETPNHRPHSHWGLQLSIRR